MEYALGEGYLPGTARLRAHDKPLLILRTFSKAHGLAGLRIGYGVSNDAGLLRGMNLVRTPFNVNAIAQAGALAALELEDDMAAMVARVTAERERVARALSSVGCASLPSRGNFLFVDAGQPSDAVAVRLIDSGVIVKPWRQPGNDTFFRVSIGLPHENDQFLGALPRAL